MGTVIPLLHQFCSVSVRIALDVASKLVLSASVSLLLLLFQMATNLVA